MNIYLTYGIVFVTLLLSELLYFKIADYFNIIDKPNERSSHTTIVLRGGGILFTIALWIWSGLQMVNGGWCGLSPTLPSGEGECYPWMVVAVTLAAGVSFIDDIHSLPDSVRLVIQFVAMFLMFYQLGMLQWELWWMVPIALIVCVGATNIINFMDGINGITGAYALATLIPVYLMARSDGNAVTESLALVVILATVVFCYFNFRPKGKAKCFAGDVGSVGMAFILLFLIGLKVMETGDVTYLIFLVLYGLDGVITICHRIMLHENLGEAHRKHSYQIMANEMGMSHVTVSLIYAVTQLCINLVFVYVIPNTVVAHWIYMIAVIVVFGAGFLLFRKKYYHLHEEYLASL